MIMKFYKFAIHRKLMKQGGSERTVLELKVGRRLHV